MTDEERKATAQAKRERKNEKRAKLIQSMVIGEFDAWRRLTNARVTLCLSDYKFEIDETPRADRDPVHHG